MSTDNSADAVKRQAQGWWADVQKKGEKQVLIEAVESGDENSPAQAERLLAIFPDAALAAIASGAPKAKAWARQRLIELAAEIKGDSPVPFLTQQMKQGSCLAFRVEAARGLLAHKHPECLKAMIEEWKKLSFSRKNGGDRDENGGVEELIGLLAGSGSAEAVHVLAEGLEEHPVDVKLSVVSAFGPSGNMSVFATGSGGSLTPANVKTDDVSWRTAVEDLLVSALDDDERRLGMSATWGEKSFSDPRICDVAGHVLWSRWPKKYIFDIAAAPIIRDRQRLELKNTWRKQHGLPPLELPHPPQIRHVSEDEIKPLWNAVLHAVNEQDRSKAVSAIEARGLSALPAARKLLATVPVAAPLRPILERLVHRLSAVVREVIVDVTVPDDHALAKASKTLVGRPLTAEQFVDLILAYTRQPPPHVPGITLSAEWTDGDSGVVVRLNKVRRKAIQGGSQKGWDLSEHVSSGREALLSSSGASSYDYGQKAEAYRDFALALDLALSDLSEVPINAIVTVVQEK